MTGHEAILKIFRFRSRRDNLPWSAPRGTRNQLAEVYREAKFNVGVEIGTRYGVYAKLLCKTNPDLHLYCVDPWLEYKGLSQERQDRIYDIAMMNLADCDVSIIKKNSMEALEEFKDRSLDFVFVDGNHQFDYAAPDIIFWAKKVKRGGIMSVHDYRHFLWSGVVEAVNAYTRCHHIDPWFITGERNPTAFWVNP